jgi:uncharacterized membrane-anchored protein YhcB (DUF1043 family)
MRDLPPQKDPKGGSSKTPSGGIPVRDFQMGGDYPIIATNGYGIWRAVATGLGGLVIGLLLAWFTAFTSKGVTQAEMQEYVTKYSPYSMEKASINEHNQTQDGQIGELRGKQDRVFERLQNLESKLSNDERELSEFKENSKNKFQDVANLLDEQRKAKK